MIRYLRCFFIGLLFIVWVGCGRKRPPVTPPAPAPAPVSVSSDAGSWQEPDELLPAVRPEPSIRVLLEEEFSRIEIRGTTRGQRLLVQVQGERMTLYTLSEGESEVLETGTGFSFEAPEGGLVELPQGSYRGRVEVFLNPLGVPVVVNEISLETYLASVVPHELGPDRFPLLEALKAQSVAARSYAIAGLGSNARLGFDLYSDTRSQVYSGVGSQHPLSDQAIAETRGTVAVFQGRPIWAFYSSTCGGLTEDYHNVFKGPPIEYLRGGVLCFDQESRYYQWREQINVQRLMERLKSFGQIGRLRKLVTLDTSPNGRVLRLQLRGTEGSLELSGSDVRWGLGLRSSVIDRIEMESNSKGILTGLRVEGRGWGHGVGLCQIGAVDLARKGHTHEEILAHYYPGIELRAWYNAAVSASSGSS